MKFRARAAALTAVAAALALFSLPGLATAATAPTAPAPIPATYFGIPATIQLAGTQAATFLTIPPVIGIQPTSLAIGVQWPANISSGTLEAINTTDNDLRVSSLSSTGATTNGTWVIPISSTVTRPEVLEITSSLTFGATGATCGPVVSNSVVRLFPSLMAYTPVENSYSVGTYLVGPIATVNIVLPPDPDRVLIQAAINLDVAVVSNAIDKDLDVNLLPSTQPLPPTSPTVRNVVFTGTGASGIAVDSQQMTISGATPLAQVRLLTTNQQLLAEGKTRAITVPGATIARSTTLSLQQLGVTQANQSGIGTFSIPVSFDQVMAGGQVASATFSLQGSAAAQASGTAATVTAMLGNTPLATETIPNDGRWQLTGSIPSELMSRTVNLQVQVGYFGGQGRCSGLLPLQVDVSPRNSTLTFTPGPPSAPVSFLNAPQLLFPSASVVLGNRSLGNLQEMIDLVAGMQRMAPLPLELHLIKGHVVPSTPSIVVAGSPSPLAHTLIPAALINDTAQFTSPIGIERVILGSSEAILTVSTTTPTIALLNGSLSSSSGKQLLSAIGNSQNAWLNLRGNVVATTPDGQIAEAQVGQAATASPAEAVAAWYNLGWVRIVLGVILLIIGLAAGFALGRRRGGSAKQIN